MKGFELTVNEKKNKGSYQRRNYQRSPYAQR